jgi:hypothetical protein
MPFLGPAKQGKLVVIAGKLWQEIIPERHPTANSLLPYFGLFCDHAAWYCSPRNALQRDVERAHAYLAKRYSISDVGPANVCRKLSVRGCGRGFATAIMNLNLDFDKCGHELHAAIASSSVPNTVKRSWRHINLKVLVANGDGLTNFASPPSFLACTRAFTTAPIPDESITGMASRFRIRK